jgi:hypothetical protein
VLIDDGEWKDDCNNIYRLIFTLPSLKYNKLSFFSWDMQKKLKILVPRVVSDQFSSIEYLIIKHNITISELLSMLHRTPRLRHLTCGNLIQSNTNKSAVILSNLTYLRIINSQLRFDEFELFISKINSKLEVLNIRQLWNNYCFDAERWERLIKN